MNKRITPAGRYNEVSLSTWSGGPSTGTSEDRPTQLTWGRKVTCLNLLFWLKYFQEETKLHLFSSWIPQQLRIMWISGQVSKIGVINSTTKWMWNTATVSSPCCRVLTTGDGWRCFLRGASREIWHWSEIHTAICQTWRRKIWHMEEQVNVPASADGFGWSGRTIFQGLKMLQKFWHVIITHRHNKQRSHPKIAYTSSMCVFLLLVSSLRWVWESLLCSGAEASA